MQNPQNTLKRSREEEEATPNKEPKAEQIDPSQHWKTMKIEDAIAYLEQVKKTFKHNPQVYTDFLVTMKKFKALKLAIPEVIAIIRDMFRGYKDLVLGFNAFLPPGFEIEADPEVAPVPNSEQSSTGTPELNIQAAYQYIMKIKERLGPLSEQYKGFLTILATFQREEITIKKVFEQVQELFKDEPDLLDDFMTFLPIKDHVQKIKKKKEKKKPVRRASSRRNEESSKKSGVDDEIEEEVSLDNPQTQLLFDAIKQQLGNNDAYNEFLKCVSLYSTGVIGKQELINLSDDIIGNFPEFKEFKKLVSSSQSTLEDRYEKGKDIALRQSSKYGPSYRLLPKNFPQAVCSERDQLCRDVLNDEFVSVVAGSEEGNGEFSKKSQADEILFQCEDDRCELDIVIEQNESTIILLTPFALKLQTEPLVAFKLEELRDLHRASISRIYGDRGPEILEGLRKNPSIAIGVILKRLKQKDQEWRSARIELNKFWKEVYDKNYKKSYEIRSGEFKTSDRKSLSMKFILQDLEELNIFSKTQDTIVKDTDIQMDILTILSGLHEMKDKNLITRFTDFLNVLCGFSKPKVSTTYPPLREVKVKPSPYNNLYGNSSLCLLMRYYMIMYERLSQAKELATEIVKVDATQASSIVNEQQGYFRKEEKEIQFKRFLALTIQFANGELEPGKYEMDCREMLGYQSFFAHTMDKLCAAIVKQIQAVFSDSKAMSLLRAFGYEMQRYNSFTDQSYLFSASLLNGTDKLYSIQFYTETKIMAVAVVDPVHVVKVNEPAKHYVENFVATTDSPTFSFLQRTIQKPSKAKTMHIQGLQCRLLLKHSKLFYVEDTEDFFHRIRNSPQRKHRANNTKWLSNWSDKRIAQL